MENINNFVYRKLQISEGCETHMGNGVIHTLRDDYIYA